MRITSGVSRTRQVSMISNLFYRRIARIVTTSGFTPTYSCHTRFRFLSSLLKPWPEPLYECDGDYRKETFLEEHIGGPLYAEQKTLPRLPIPSIEETINRFLPTALPLAKSDEERAELLSACRRFPTEAHTLQDRLRRYRDVEMKDSSWLQLWWNQMGYLQVRDSLVFNVSYFLQLKDDPTIQATALSQVQRAASLLVATAKFREEVCSGQLPPDRVGKHTGTLLCSCTYKYLFNACRIPFHQQDSYFIFDPYKNKHIIVARKGHFFSFDFVDEVGDPFPKFILEQQLQKCIEMADQIPSTRPKLGLLTAVSRDSWATSRESLIKSGGEKMQEALLTLQSGSIMLCLDSDTPESLQDCSQQFLSGGQGSSHNRWFDKSINLIVTPAGEAAVLCEHSMMDGTATLRYADRIASVKSTEVSNEENEAIVVPGVADIFADAFAEMTESCRLEIASLVEQSRVECMKNVERHSNVVNTFDAYGGDFIKTAGHSPDAFVQMAIHLATYRLFGQEAATYEATQVRPFLHGRTETTRSVSLESAAFVEKMGQSPTWSKDDDDDTVRKEKLELLKKATTAHSQYSMYASRAQGVDRHFFGLSAIVEGSEIAPSLYSNALFNHSKRWRVSTSNLTHPKIVNWGFGQVVPEGVGIAYSVHAQSCVFNIVGLQDINVTDQLSKLIDESLHELHMLVESDPERTI